MRLHSDLIPLIHRKKTAKESKNDQSFSNSPIHEVPIVNDLLSLLVFISNVNTRKIT